MIDKIKPRWWAGLSMIGINLLNFQVEPVLRVGRVSEPIVVAAIRPEPRQPEGLKPHKGFPVKRLP